MMEQGVTDEFPGRSSTATIHFPHLVPFEGEGTPSLHHQEGKKDDLIMSGPGALLLQRAQSHQRDADASSSSSSSSAASSSSFIAKSAACGATTACQGSNGLNPLFGPNGRQWESRSTDNVAMNKLKNQDYEVHDMGDPTLFMQHPFSLLFSNTLVEAEFLVFLEAPRRFALLFCVLATVTSAVGVAMYKGLPASAKGLFAVTVLCWGMCGFATGYLMWDVSKTLQASNLTSRHKTLISQLNHEDPVRAQLRWNAAVQERVAAVTHTGCFLFAMANYLGKGTCYNPVWSYEDELRGCRRAIQAEATILIMIAGAVYAAPVRAVYSAVAIVLLTVASFALRFVTSTIVLIHAYFWGSVAVLGTEIAVCLVSAYLREKHARQLFAMSMQRHHQVAELADIRRRTERIVAGHLPVEVARACRAASATSPLSGFLFAWSKTVVVLGIGIHNFGAWSSKRAASDVVETLQRMTCHFDLLQKKRFDGVLPAKYPAHGDTYLLMEVSDGKDGKGAGLSAAHQECATHLYRFAIAALSSGSRLLQRLVRRAPFAEDENIPALNLVGCLSVGLGGGMMHFAIRSHYPVGPVVDDVLSVVSPPHVVPEEPFLKDMSIDAPSPKLVLDESLAVIFSASGDPSSDTYDISLSLQGHMTATTLSGMSTTMVPFHPLSPCDSTNENTPLNSPLFTPLSPFSSENSETMQHPSRVSGVSVIIRKQPVSCGGSLSHRHGTGMKSMSLSNSLEKRRDDHQQNDPSKTSSLRVEALRVAMTAELSRPQPSDKSSGGSLLQKINSFSTARRSKTQQVDEELALNPCETPSTRIVSDGTLALHRYCLTLFRFSDPIAEAQYHTAQGRVSHREVMWCVTSSLLSTMVLIGLCGIDMLVSMRVTSPLTWAVMGCFLCVFTLACANTPWIRWDSDVWRWTLVTLLLLVQVCYLAAVATAPANTILGDSQMIFLFVQVQWSFNKPLWLSWGVLWFHDVIISIFFFLRTALFFHMPTSSSMLQLTMLAEMLMIPYTLAFRLVFDYSQRKRFALEFQVEALKKGLADDAKRLLLAIKTTVPVGTMGVLVQRARERSGVVSGRRRVEGTSICTATSETPFVLIEVMPVDCAASSEDARREQAHCVASCIAAMGAKAKRSSRIQFVKASHNKVLFCAYGHRHDEDRATKIVAFTADIKDLLRSAAHVVKCRAVAGSGYLMGAVIGRVGVTFDYYGAELVNAHALLSALEWCTVVVTARLTALHLTHMTRGIRERDADTHLQTCAKVAGFNTLWYRQLTSLNDDCLIAH